MVNAIKRIGVIDLLTGREKKDNHKSLIAIVRPNGMCIFNQLLKLFGFSNIDVLVYDFISRKFLHYSIG